MFDMDKIKYGTDEATFTRAVALYEKRKVTRVKCVILIISSD